MKAIRLRRLRSLETATGVIDAQAGFLGEYEHSSDMLEPVTFGVRGAIDLLHQRLHVRGLYGGVRLVAVIGAEALKYSAPSGLRFRRQTALARWFRERIRIEILSYQPIDAAYGIGPQPWRFLDDGQRWRGVSARGVIRVHELDAAGLSGQRSAAWPVVDAQLAMAITVLF
jgi:hypothetical protein